MCVGEKERERGEGGETITEVFPLICERKYHYMGTKANKILLEILFLESVERKAGSARISGSLMKSEGYGRLLKGLQERLLIKAHNSWDCQKSR